MALLSIKEAGLLVGAAGIPGSQPLALVGVGH